MLETLESLDKAWFLSLNSFHYPWLDGLMWQLSKSWHTYLVALLCGWLVYKKFSPRKAAEFILGCAIVVACSDLSSNVIKHSVKRFRPSHNTELMEKVHTVNEYRGGQYGFFSAHASNNFALSTFIFLCFSWYKKNRRILLYVYATLVSYSRIYLGVHYPADIAAGAVWGVLVAFPVYSLINRFFLKWYV